MAKSSLRESTVRVYGDTAVLIGDVVNDDPKQPGSLRVTTVFQKRPQGWQMIAAHLAGSGGMRVLKVQKNRFLAG